MTDIVIFMRERIFTAGILLLFLATTAQAAYQPPVGIPAPPFGIDEKVGDYYDRPTPWNQETPGWYYIDQYHPNASDKNTYGTPEAPRRTLPSDIPAGSVVEIHGRYDHAPAGYDILKASGEPGAPVFIVGGSGTASGPGIILRKWKVHSSYTIIENLQFTVGGKVEITYPSHHVSLRNSELYEMKGKIGGGGRSNNERLHHIVIFQNKIHSQEGWNEGLRDIDNHGIKFGPYTEDIWILENVGYHNAGDFIQVGDWGDGTVEVLNRTRRYYIGRNTVYENRQSPLGIKQSTDIIISENRFYNSYKIQSNVDGQPGIYFLYGPENIWIINNIIHDSNGGIGGGSNSGGQGENIYIIGNLIYNIKGAPETEYRPDSAWSAAAIRLAGGVKRYIINNTIYNIDAGINIPSNHAVYIANNLIWNVDRGYHINIGTSEATSRAEVYNNLLFQDGGTMRVRTARGPAETIGMMETSLTSSGNIEAAPMLDLGTWTPNIGSPVIDKGTTAGFVETVFQRFEDLYGIDIRKDIYGTPRPQGNGWDIGAVEWKATSAEKAPSAPRNVKATVVTTQ